MVVAIGAEHGAPVSKSAAAELILPFTAAALGRGVSQYCAEVQQGQRRATSRLSRAWQLQKN
jgi:hypothetical protein